MLPLQGGLRVAAVDARAEATGIVPGIPLADARALVPGVRVVPGDPLADAGELAGLADWCGRYSPWTACDATADAGGGGLWLDVSGCAHLFGGEEALLADLTARLDRLGYTARAALADGPGAAWALARFAPLSASRLWRVVAPGQSRDALSCLPVAALRLPAETATALERLGLATVGDLEAAPRASLAARFGGVLVTRLDQAMNRRREPISPRQPAAAVQARVVFAEPIGHLDDVRRAARRLVEKVCDDLGRRRHGARKLVLALYRVDSKVATAAIGTARPVRDPHHLARLFAERLDGLDLGFGADAMALSVTRAQPLAPEQLSLVSRFRSSCDFRHCAQPLPLVMPGLVPGIHESKSMRCGGATWMAGTSPATTNWTSDMPGGLPGPATPFAMPGPRIKSGGVPDISPSQIARTPRKHVDGRDTLGSSPGAGHDGTGGTASVQPPPGAAGVRAAPGEADADAALDRLADRLGNRLGAGNVVRFAPRASFLPERAVAACAPLGAPAAGVPAAVEIPWLRGRPRPLCLFLRPEPIEAMAPVSDRPPVLFRWRRRLHRVVWAEGPERLGTEWWREAALSAMPGASRTRDYFRVEDGDGRRFWLYRNGLYRAAAAAPVPVVDDREAEPEKPHRRARHRPGALPETPPSRPAAPAGGAPAWFVHGIFA